jgi:putative DNA primase/helicase
MLSGLNALQVNRLERLFPIEEYEPKGDVVEANITVPLQLATIPINTRVASCNVLPPAELQALPIWCPWRYEPKKDKQGNIIPDARPDKVPYQVGGRAPQKAKVDTPATWSTYAQAQHAYEEAIKWNFRDKYDGISFMCDGSFVGIDLDHCRNKETGEIEPWAQAIIDRFPSYGYVTPSEEGIRIVIHATKPGPRCKKGDIEIYEKERFFTWTPMQLPGTPEAIEDCQEQLTALYDETFPLSTPSKEVQESTRVFTLSCHCSDDEVLNKARGAANGPKFITLWEGKTDGYKSQSEADLALCGMLKYWTNDDPSAMDRLFRRSGLYRAERWDSPARAGETYGEGTIRIAIEGPA